MESGRVYVLNRAVDREGDLGDIRLALYYTPLYCVLITSIYDLDLAREFAEPSNIYTWQQADSVMEAAWEYASASEMAVLVIGEAQRLDEVKKDGTKEPVCL
jgi:hypothetical protein